jgi:predicted ribosomally synthesized peptide with SipW-like signal peptide
MSDDSTTWTRRKLLSGIGVVGAAAAAGAGGTYALLSDTEQSTDNSLTTGTLNLRAGGSESATTSFSASELGTGSSGSASSTVTNTGTLDGYLNFGIEEIRNLENGIANDAESGASNENGGQPGELSQYITLRLGYDGNENGFGSGDVVVEGPLDGMENVQFKPNVPIQASASKDFYVEWEIAGDAGNEVQSDRTEIDFDFQLREREADADVVLTGETPYGQGAGFSEPWETSSTLAQSGVGSWGTTSGTGGKHGFYFAGDFSSISTLSGYTVSEIAEISYSLYEPTALEGNDVYLVVYTRPENDGDDGASWYDSRLVALPVDANNGSPNFTPGEWNEFSTASGTSNTLVFDDSGHKSGNAVGPTPLPTLSELRSGAIDWSTYGSSLTSTRDYRDEEVKALSLQTNSTSGQSLEAFVDDVTVELTSGETLNVDLEP